jgi:hypothetical protein
MFVYNGNTSAWEQVAVSTSGFPTLAGNNNFTGLNTFTNAGTADVLRVTNTGTGNSFVVEDSANPDGSPTVIDATGQIVRGHTTWTNIGLLTAGMQTHNNSGTEYGGLGLIGWRNNTALPAALHFAKSNSSVVGTQAAVASGTDLGRIGFFGSDGTDFITSSLILGEADATPSTGIVPGRLVFSTADSAGTMTERIRIDSAGNIGITAPAAAGRNFALASYLTGSATARGYTAIGTIKSDVTSLASYFATSVSTEAQAFTLSTLHHFVAIQGTLGAGSAITTQIGYVAGSTLTGATNNYGFYGDIPSGTNRWNFVANGTAANYFAGRTGIGATLTSGAMAQVVNTTAADVGFVVKGAASQSGALQQWQNSSGTVLASVNSTGQFVGDGSQLTGISAGVSVATLEEVEQQVIMGALL